MLLAVHRAIPPVHGSLCPAALCKSDLIKYSYAWPQQEFLSVPKGLWDLLPMGRGPGKWLGFASPTVNPQGLASTNLSG